MPKVAQPKPIEIVRIERLYGVRYTHDKRQWWWRDGLGVVFHTPHLSVAKAQRDTLANEAGLNAMVVEFEAE